MLLLCNMNLNTYLSSDPVNREILLEPVNTLFAGLFCLLESSIS